MTDLEKYVDELFRHQRLTSEVRDLKEEILTNMVAKRDDLIAQGFDKGAATEKAKESLSSIDSLVDGNQLTYIDRYRADCLQTIFLNCIIFWILSLPLLFAQYAFAIFSYMGLLLTLVFGVLYFGQSKKQSNAVTVVSIAASERRRKIVWIIWGLFFIVCAGAMAAVTFGSNVWFGRSLNISGPYQLASIAVRFYLPLLTIVIPITIGSFTKILLKSRKEYEDD